MHSIKDPKTLEQLIGQTIELNFIIDNSTLIRSMPIPEAGDSHRLEFRKTTPSGIPFLLTVSDKKWGIFISGDYVWDENNTFDGFAKMAGV